MMHIDRPQGQILEMSLRLIFRASSVTNNSGYYHNSAYHRIVARYRNNVYQGSNQAHRCNIVMVYQPPRVSQEETVARSLSSALRYCRLL